MSIKQSIALLVLFWGVSFSAFAEYLRVTTYGGNYHLVTGCTGVDIGSVVKVGSRSLGNSYGGGTCESVTVSGKQISVSWRNRKGLYSGSMYGSSALSCPSGEVLNPETGKCEEAPEPYCSKQDTINEMNRFKDSCFDKGAGWTPEISCSDANQNLEMSCNPPPPDPDKCEPGSPNFPACLDDDKKCDESSPDWDANEGRCCNESNNYCDEKPPKPCTIFNRDEPHCKDDNDDVDPPTPDDDLDDPDFPDFPDDDGSGDPDVSEPPVNPENDANKAINELNKDLNKQLTRINNDLNNNHKESLTALGAVKSSLDLNTQSVLDGANHVADAVNSQTDVMTKLGNKSNEYLKSVNGLLKDGFDDLGRELGEVGNGIDGIGETLKGLKDSLDVVPKTDGVVPLYSADALAGLRSEVETLKSDYEAELQKMKSYFNFSSSVSSGDFNAHNLELNWHGNAINKTNQVFVTMRDNAGIISAVVLFFFGMAGIKEIMRA
ncbi:hypothetical protein RRM58_002151 [Vibrio harveyi]|nr:hypothetical protein [Vibrio harveyi]